MRLVSLFKLAFEVSFSRGMSLVSLFKLAFEVMERKLLLLLLVVVEQQLLLFVLTDKPDERLGLLEEVVPQRRNQRRSDYRGQKGKHC
jgi:hypothetical protein